MHAHGVHILEHARIYSSVTFWAQIQTSLFPTILAVKIIRILKFSTPQSAGFLLQLRTSPKKCMNDVYMHICDSCDNNSTWRSSLPFCLYLASYAQHKLCHWKKVHAFTLRTFNRVNASPGNIKRVPGPEPKGPTGCYDYFAVVFARDCGILNSGNRLHDCDCVCTCAR